VGLCVPKINVLVEEEIKLPEVMGVPDDEGEEEPPEFVTV
jgi:hypothetical protein